MPMPMPAPTTGPTIVVSVLQNPVTAAAIWPANRTIYTVNGDATSCVIPYALNIQ
jgi:hypothetical protein